MTPVQAETDIPTRIRDAWSGYTPAEAALAARLRATIFAVAAETPEVGGLTEALRWGQAAYLTEETGSGTTLRIARASAGRVGLYVHCQSRVVDEVRMVHDRALTWDGTRGLLLDTDASWPEAAVRAMIVAALTYRL